MRFLADESCDFAVVRALRASGHDVTVVAERARGAPDEAVIALAVREDGVLLTEDKDFGQLVYARQEVSGGVLLLRFPARARAAIARSVDDLVQTRGDTLLGRFVVVQPGRVRVGPSRKG